MDKNTDTEKTMLMTIAAEESRVAIHQEKAQLLPGSRSKLSIKLDEFLQFETRRSRGDLIETFKILTGRDNLKPEHFFEATKSSSTRGYGCKLYRKVTGSLKNNYFSTRVINLWNKLDDETIYSDSVEAFKIRLSKFGY